MKHLYSLLWFMLLHCISLYLFTKGFFLTRFEVTDASECSILPCKDCIYKSNLRSSDHLKPIYKDEFNCWMPQRYKRVIFLVIDALRYDFVDAGRSKKEASPMTSIPSFYLNHLPILKTTLAEKPYNSLLLKFVADPPTMTMQRLKGLTTGSLPTFLDIKDNMASSEITEDNLIHQMYQAGRSIVFMGDDTWESLYAKYFTRAYGFDSFNVKDLHTVDNGVLQYLYPELQKDDWSLLIAHFLGVDHVGHTYGPSSPYMTKKLHQMNDMLDKLLNEISNEYIQDDKQGTLLVVLGDHGMSADGNHGGASDEETGAALFLYSNTPLLAATDLNIKWPTSVPQVDIVPTLALLMGIPIPFGNLGAIIPQLFLFTALNSDGDSNAARQLAAYKNLNNALRLNVDQVRRYLLTYSAASKLPPSEYQALETLFETVNAHQELIENSTLHTSNNFDDETLNKLHQDLMTSQFQYLREAFSLGQSIWTQFDLCSMAWGISILTLAVILKIMHTLGMLMIQIDTFNLLMFGIGAFIGIIDSYLRVIPLLPSPSLSRVCVVGALINLCSVCMRMHFGVAWKSLRSMNKRQSLVVLQSSFVPMLVVLLHILSLLSNSYIVAESQVMAFLSSTIGFFMCVQSLKYPRKYSFILSLILLVVSRFIAKIDPPNIIQTNISVLQTVIPTLIYITTICSALLTKHAMLSSMESLMLAFISIISMFATIIYWIMSPIDQAIWRLGLPRFVLSIVPLSICYCMWNLYSHNYSRNKPNFVILFMTLYPSYCLVLGPSSPLSVLAIVTQSMGIAFHFKSSILCLLDIKDSTNEIDSSLSPTWVFLFCTIGYQSYFLTGHQNTFTSLQNAAGFIGMDTFHFIYAGILLAFNTFGNYLVGSLAYFIPFLATFNGKSQSHAIRQHAKKWSFIMAIYYSLNALVSMIFVAIQRRHLMVWAIFAPKYIFDGMTLVVIDIVIMIIYSIL